MDMTDKPQTGTERCLEISSHLAWIGDRWTLPVVVTLASDAQRFNQLRRSVDGISQQMLTRTLRKLERDGMITRTVFPTVPPQVEYELTDLGRSLASKGQELGQWVADHEAQINDSREMFDDNSN